LWWFGYVILVLFLGLIVWLWVPGGGRSSPLLILAEDAEGKVEGIVRLAARGDRAVLIRLGRGKEVTEEILRRLQLELPNVSPVDGDLDTILTGIAAPVVQVVRLGRATDVREVLRSGL